MLWKNQIGGWKPNRGLTKLNTEGSVGPFVFSEPEFLHYGDGHWRRWSLKKCTWYPVSGAHFADFDAL